MKKEEHSEIIISDRKKAMSNRLAKIVGHTKSVKTMVENGRDCSEVLIQLAAVRSAIHNAGKEILKEHIKHTMDDAVRENDPQKIKELNHLIDSFLK